MKLIETTQAVGHVLCHDMTQIIPGVTKDARFRKGHVVTEEDIPVLLSMGKEHLYVWEKTPGMLHENEGAERLRAICQGASMRPTPVKEGKIELIAETDGLFRVDADRLAAVNSVGDVIVATRHTNTAVRAGDKLAGMRVVPLVIPEETLAAAEQAAGEEPLLSLTPWKRRTAAIIATGSEVQKGLIEDRFTPVVQAKLADFGVRTICTATPGDDREAITAAIHAARDQGAEIVLCTGGMSVDPDDRTPGAIRAAGPRIVTYGAPVLPGAMLLVGYFDDGTPILGLPGCVMYAKTSVFDLLLPQIVADVPIRREEIVRMGEGGLCLGCGQCHFPNCGFGR